MISVPDEAKKRMSFLVCNDLNLHEVPDMHLRRYAGPAMSIVTFTHFR